MSAEWIDFQTRGQVQKLNSQVAGFLNPVGAIQLWAGSQDGVPAGWMICNGSSVLKSAYPELFAVIGGAFGSVDVDHFTIPNFIDRFAIGVGANGIGSSGGSKTITTENMPNHNHPNTASPTGIALANATTGLSITSTADLPDHTHNYSSWADGQNTYNVAGGNQSCGQQTRTSGSVNSTPAIAIANTTNDPSHTHAITDAGHTHTSGVVGGGADYLQPFTSIFYTICYTAKFPTA